MALAHALKRTVAGLALPDGAAEKLRQAVTPPGAAGAAPAHPLQASLGDAILVRGYDTSAETVPAGGTLEVTYHFVAGKPLPTGWRLFFHLEGPVGYRNLDHVPVDGLMPLERWRPGQALRDRQRIPIPPGTQAGTYTLYVGAYRGPERLPVIPASLSDGKSRLRLLSFTVTPSTPRPGPSPAAIPVPKSARGRSALSPPR